MSLRRTLWLSAILILALSVVACGKPSTEGTAPEATQPVAETAAASTPSAAGPAQPAATQVSQATAAATAAATPLAAAANDTEDPEPNTIEQAMPIEAGETPGSLIEDDEDWFKIDFPEGSQITVALTVKAGAGPMNLRWVDPDQYELWSDYGVLETAEHTLLLGNTGGTHRLHVSGQPGDYVLQVAIESQDDGGSGGDAGDEITGALQVRLGDVVKGVVGDYDEYDWYRFDVPDGSVLNVSITAGQGAPGLHAQLLNADQIELWSEYDVRSGKQAATTQVMSTDSGGTHYIAVHGTGVYTVALDAVQQDDAGSGDDAGDAIQDAVPIELAIAYEGLLGGEDSEDWYETEVPAGVVVTVQFTPQPGGNPLHVTAYGPEEYVFWEEYEVRPGKTASGSYVLADEGGFTLFLCIHGSGGGAYRFSIDTAAQDDAGSGGDAPSSMYDALDVDTDVEHAGQIGDEDYEDWYTFSPSVGQVVRFTVARGAEPLHIILLDDDESEQWSEYDVRAGKTVEFEIAEVESEPFYIQIHGAKGSYTFQVVEP